MVGKTFKGMTDKLLQWQTQALLEREVERRGIAVFVRPELVVEIALDGVPVDERPRARAHAAKEVAHASSMTRLTTCTNDFQSAVSVARCFRPAAVMA